MNNILILFIIIIIFIIILFIDYNYCIENFAPKHKNKISKNKNVETFYTDQVEDCFIEPFKYFKSEYDTKSLTEIIYSIWQERESMWDYYAETDDIIYNHLQKRIENNNPRPGGESGNIEGWRTIYIYINKEKKNLNLKFKYYKKEKTSQLSIAVAKRYAASEIIFIDNDEDEDINKEETISFQNTDELDILGIWLSSGVSIYTDLKLSYSDNIAWDDDCDLSNCINKIKTHKTKLCNDLDKCRIQEVNGITSKYTIDSSTGSNTNKVHWINHNDKFYLNKDDTDAIFDVTRGNDSMILNNVYYCDADDAKCPTGKDLFDHTCCECQDLMGDGHPYYGLYEYPEGSHDTTAGALKNGGEMVKYCEYLTRMREESRQPGGNLYTYIMNDRCGGQGYASGGGCWGVGCAQYYCCACNDGKIDSADPDIPERDSGLPRFAERRFGWSGGGGCAE